MNIMMINVRWLMHRRTITAATAAILLYTAGIGTFNYVKAPKVGYINNSVLLEKYPGAQQAREQLNKKSQEWKKNIETLEAELNQLNQEILQNASTWDKQKLAAKEDSIKRKQTEYTRYSRAISEKASQTETELFQPVYTELNAKISEFGKAKGLDIILGTVSGGNILYAQEATDLTEKFLAYANTAK